MWGWLVWVGLALAGGPSDLEGQWRLDHDVSDTLDPLLEAQGVGAFLRGIVRRADIRQQIVGKPGALSVTIASSIIKETRDLHLDGVIREEPGRQGRVVHVSHVVEDDGVVVSTTRLTTHDGHPAVLTVRRRAIEDGATMRLDMVLAVESRPEVKMVRVFRRMH